MDVCVEDLSVFLYAVLAWSIRWKYGSIVLCFTTVAVHCMCVLLCMPSYRYCRRCSWAINSVQVSAITEKPKSLLLLAGELYAGALCPAYCSVNAV